MIVPRVNVSSLSPMHPTLVREPFHRDGWVYEEKYDGWRITYRRQALEDTGAGAALIYPARRLHPHGLDAWGEVKQRGYEGLVAKCEASAYRAGPTREWLKVKIRHEGRFIVVGLDVPLSGACSLLLAARIGRRFAYVGRCEWGVSRRIVAELRERIAVRATPACSGIEGGRGVVWVQPRAGAEVQDNEMMQGRLRDPVLRHILLSPA